MKTGVQTLLLLTGLGLAIIALWMDWLWVNPNEVGFNVKNYMGLEVLGEVGTGYLITFYAIAILTSCIVKLGLVGKKQSLRIFKMLFAVNVLLFLAVVVLLVTGKYLSSNHIFYTPKTGLLLWIVANLLAMRWLWNFSQPPALPASHQDILDDKIEF